MRITLLLKTLRGFAKSSFRGAGAPRKDRTADPRKDRTADPRKDRTDPAARPETTRPEKREFLALVAPPAGHEPDRRLVHNVSKEHWRARWPRASLSKTKPR